MKSIFFVSGIGPDGSGTGRLIKSIVAEKQAKNLKHVKFLFQHRKTVPIKKAWAEKKYKDVIGECWKRLGNYPFWFKLWFLGRFTNAKMVFFHPQSLKTERAWKLLSGWKGPKFFFVLDAGVFCIRSYNHVFGDNKPCTRCLGRDTSHIAKRGCESFPLPDPYFQTFVEKLPELADKGGLTFLTQSSRQTTMLSGHFPPESVKTVGLWTADWDELVETLGELEEPQKPDDEFEFDVVYHGYYVSAKGADWLYEVAKNAPEIKFMYACGRHVRVGTPIKNVKFKYMTWATGLEEAIKRAKITLAPSLWSAPIEGALIKSILAAPQAGVVQTETAYSASLPDDLVLKLSPDPKEAADELRLALKNRVGPTKARRLEWWSSFRAENQSILANILNVVNSKD